MQNLLHAQRLLLCSLRTPAPQQLRPWCKLSVRHGCVAFGRQAEFAEKYLRKGTKIALTGRIQTGSYTNRDGQKVYTTDIVVDDQEFADSKNASGGNEGGYGNSYQQSRPAPSSAIGDGFMNIPDGVEDEGLPFN